jgi:cytochrome bd-type quinol oxidase subunit 1
MKVLLDRWQFGVTITYHFLFVPLTIGLAFLVAIMQVLACRRRDEAWERLTRFFGMLFLQHLLTGWGKRHIPGSRLPAGPHIHRPDSPVD